MASAVITSKGGNKMRNIIRDFIDGVRFGAKLATGRVEFYGPVEVDTGIKTYYLYINDDYMKFAIGIMPDIPTAATIGVNTSTDVSIVAKGTAYVCNNAFLSLDKHLQACIMAHEEGHVALGHLFDKDKKPIFIETFLRKFKEHKHEFEADKYAYDLIGESYLDMLNWLGTIKGAKHIDERINSLIESSKTNKEGK
jgi:hypothetical protein